MLKFYSASTSVVNSKKAIAECIENALWNESTDNQQTLSDHVLVVIHATIGHHFPSILKEAKQLLPKARIVGCTCAGVVGKEGANESIRALAIMIVEAEQENEFCVASCSNIRGENSYEEAKNMANDLLSQSNDINMIQILASGIDIAADKAIEGVEDAFGWTIPIFGGTSSDNMKAVSSFQFLDEEVLERGAVLVGFADSTLSVEMGVHHGSIPIGMPFKVTRSKANRVFEIEGEPAWKFLMDKLNLPADTHPGPCIPIAGMGEALDERLHEEYDNKHILRVIVKVDDDYSFYMPVDCAEGTELWITERNEQLIFEGLDRMMAQLKKRIGDKEVVAVFHTDCAARGRAMFNKILKEEIINKMQYPLVGDAQKPWLGMYGFGEFTLLNGKNYFHNYTTSLYALVR